MKTPTMTPEQRRLRRRLAQGGPSAGARILAARFAKLPGYSDSVRQAR